MSAFRIGCLIALSISTSLLASSDVTRGASWSPADDSQTWVGDRDKTGTSRDGLEKPSPQLPTISAVAAGMEMATKKPGFFSQHVPFVKCKSPASKADAGPLFCLSTIHLPRSDDFHVDNPRGGSRQVHQQRLCGIHLADVPGGVSSHDTNVDLAGHAGTDTPGE